MALTPEKHKLLMDAFRAMDVRPHALEYLDRSPSLAPILMRTLKDLRFDTRDLQADGDGQIDITEFSVRAKNLGDSQQSVEDLFHFFDDRGAVHRKHRSDCGQRNQNYLYMPRLLLRAVCSA